MASTLNNPKGLAPAAFEAELAKLLDGVRENLPPDVELVVHGEPQHLADIEARLQGWIAAFEAVVRAKASYRYAVAARVGITAEARQFEKALKATLKQHFGTQSPVLASLGIPVDQPISQSTAQRLLAAARRAQTRALRGTRGRGQQLVIDAAGTPRGEG